MTKPHVEVLTAYGKSVHVFTVWPSKLLLYVFGLRAWLLTLDSSHGNCCVQSVISADN